VDDVRASSEDAKVSVLRRAIDARHIAIFGASATPGKWGYNVPAGLLRSGFTGTLTLVNPRGGEVCGLPLVDSDEAAGADLAILATPPATVPDVLRTCGDLEIPVAVVSAGGFGEVGNAVLQDELMSAVTESHVRVIGPNCFGLYVGGTGLNVTTVPYLPPGSISCICQSGGVIQQVGMRLSRLGYGYDVVLALGNKSDVGFADSVAAIASRETTSALLLYLERFDEGDRLLDILEQARKTLSIVCLIGGRTDVGRRMAASHTASLAGSWERMRAILSDIDVLVVDDMQHAAAAAIGGMRSAPARRQRVFALYDGGGHSVLVADHLRSAGFSMPAPQDALSVALSEVQRPGNPFDFGATDPRQVLTDFPRLLEEAVASKQYDVVVLGPQLGGGYKALVGDEAEELENEALAQIGEIADRADECSIVIQTLHAPDPLPSLEAVRSARVPCVEWTSEVVDVLQARTASEARSNFPAPDGSAGTDYASGQRYAADSSLVSLTDRLARVLDSNSVRHCLGQVVTSLSLAATRDGRWVLRADGFPHKTAAGAIRLNLSTSDLRSNFIQLSNLAADAGLTPVIRLAPYLAHDEEFIVAFWRSSAEGSGWLIGRGGTSVEDNPDLAIGRMPSSELDVARALEKTTCGRQLRTRHPVAATELIRTVLKIAMIFNYELTDLEELECNPLAVAGNSIYVLDALPRLRELS
jgi:acetate---CoA ligase (ADP-forming)